MQILTQAAAEEHRATHIPGTIGYKISDVMTDLVNLAVKYLRVCVCAPMRGVDGVLLTHICGPMCVCVCVCVCVRVCVCVSMEQEGST